MTREKIQRYAACKEGVYTWWCPSVEVAEVETERDAALGGEKELQREICRLRACYSPAVCRHGKTIQATERVIAKQREYTCFEEE